MMLKNAAAGGRVPGVSVRKGPSKVDDMQLQLVMEYVLEGYWEYKDGTSCVVALNELYGPELPVWDARDTKRPGSMLFVIGGVRDLTQGEEGALAMACDRAGVLCVGANVGVTAEFTSKIAASLIGQFQLGRLSCAVQSLVLKGGKRAAQNLIKRAPVKIRQEAPTTKASKLDFFVWVPLRVSQVSSSTGVRDRMYILQRTCV